MNNFIKLIIKIFASLLLAFFSAPLFIKIVDLTKIETLLGLCLFNRTYKIEGRIVAHGDCFWPQGVIEVIVMILLLLLWISLWFLILHLIFKIFRKLIW